MPHALAPHDRLGRYEVVRLLGEGGSGQVYEAVLHGPAGFRKQVALKALRHVDRALGDGGLVREARLGGLLRHRNLVEVFALEQIDGTWVCAMELVRGGSLAGKGPLPPRAVVDIGLQVCAALQYAHAELGLVHLDLKPANLLLDGGRVKVADLGISQARGFQWSRGVHGTPAYMAPEHLAGGAVDARSDIWSLGVSLVELATGLPGNQPGAVPWLGAVLAGCLDPEPAGRFPTMAALAEALDEVRAELAEDPDELGFGLDRGVSRPATNSNRSRTDDGATFPLDALSTRPQRTNLALPRSAFVGRQRERASLAADLEAPGLVTLKGLGGIGKTRLALEVGAEVEAADEVWFCDLSAVTDALGLAAGVAAVIGVPLASVQTAEDAAERLGHAIASRGHCVLILDNLEQVADAGPVLATWLRGCPEARFLVTSRIPMDLPGERIHELPALAVADGVRLLESRGAREDDPDLAELVRRLDGIPLALELAAGRLGMMSARQVLDRLARRFDLLKSRSRGMSARQATLRGALDWSWNLLDEAERAVLAQLSVFVGGCTVEAAEAIVDPGPDHWALDVVQALMDRSMVHEREGRLLLYESVRHYAAEHLEDGSALERRHGEHYARLGSDDHLRALQRPGGTQLRDALREERANLVAAVHRAEARGDATVAARALRAAWEVFQLEGPFSQGLELAERVLALDPPDPARLIATQIGGWALRSIGRLEDAGSWFQTGLVLARKVGDRQREASMLMGCGQVAHDSGQLSTAADFFDQAEAVSTREADAFALANLELARANLAGDLGDTVGAIRHLEAARDGMRALGELQKMAHALHNLGSMHLDLGHLDEARRQYEASIDVYRKVGDRKTEGQALANLGVVHVELGQYDEASRHYASSLALARATGDRRFAATSLGAMGNLAMMQGDTDQARELLAEGRRILTEVGDTTWAAILGAYEGKRRLMVGDPQGAAEILEESVSTLEGRFAMAHAWFQGFLGEAWMLSGQRDQGRATLEASEATLREHGWRKELLQTLISRVRCERETGDPAAAERAFDLALALCDELELPPDAMHRLELEALR